MEWKTLTDKIPFRLILLLLSSLEFINIINMKINKKENLEEWLW
jgi:hypothetical protein